MRLENVICFSTASCFVTDHQSERARQAPASSLAALPFARNSNSEFFLNTAKLERDQVMS